MRNECGYWLVDTRDLVAQRVTADAVANLPRFVKMHTDDWRREIADARSSESVRKDEPCEEAQAWNNMKFKVTEAINAKRGSEK